MSPRQLGPFVKQQQRVGLVAHCTLPRRRQTLAVGHVEVRARLRGRSCRVAGICKPDVQQAFRLHVRVTTPCTEQVFLRCTIWRAGLMARAMQIIRQLAHTNHRRLRGGVPLGCHGRATTLWSHHGRGTRPRNTGTANAGPMNCCGRRTRCRRVALCGCRDVTHYQFVKFRRVTQSLLLVTSRALRWTAASLRKVGRVSSARRSHLDIAGQQDRRRLMPRMTSSGCC
jgi:hypothetical protein